MKPGQIVRLNEDCAWHERIGCVGVVVDPDSFDGFYPGDKSLKGHVIVLLQDDPMKTVDNGWTCVTEVETVEPINPSNMLVSEEEVPL